MIDAYAEQAKERQRRSEGRGKKGMATGPYLFQPTLARDQAAKQVGSSGRSVGRAKVVKEKGLRGKMQAGRLIEARGKRGMAQPG